MKPIACLGCLTAAANQTCRKSWFSREKKAVTADSRHLRKKKLFDKNLVNSRGPALVFWCNSIPTKKENNPPISSEHLFFSSRFSYYPQAFYFGTPIQSLLDKTEKQKHPFFWFYHLRSWWKKRTKFLSLPWPFFAAGASRKWPFLTAMNPTHDVDDPLLVEVQGRKI